MGLARTTAALLALVAAWSQSADAQIVSLKMHWDEGTFDVLLGETVRMTGGAPFLQGSDFAIEGVTQTVEGEVVFEGAGDRKVLLPPVRGGHSNVIGFLMAPNGNQSEGEEDFLGMLFDDIPELRQGVVIVSIPPSMASAKPVKVDGPLDLPDWGGLCFYWQYEDGVYGAAIPLSAQGCQVMMGNHKGRFAVKARLHVATSPDRFPLLAVGFGRDPYALLTDLCESGMVMMGRPEALRGNKPLPEPFHRLGWFNKTGGDDSTEDGSLAAVESFLDVGTVLGSILLAAGVEEFSVTVKEKYGIESLARPIVINATAAFPQVIYGLGKIDVVCTSKDCAPSSEGAGYDLEKNGNAGTHILLNTYNALLFSRFAYPDFNVFQSHEPDGRFHAVARALNNGPIYVADVPGKQDAAVLLPLVYQDGWAIRADRPLLPTEDCLFQVQDAKPFKAFSMSGEAGLLGVWNCADADRVVGTFSPSDVHGIAGEEFAVFDHFRKTIVFAGKHERIPVSLGRMECALYCIVPVTEGIAPIGLINKYVSPDTILRTELDGGKLTVVLPEAGEFAVAMRAAPQSVKVDGKEEPFSFENSLLRVQVVSEDSLQEPIVEVTL